MLSLEPVRTRFCPAVLILFTSVALCAAAATLVGAITGTVAAPAGAPVEYALTLRNLAPEHPLDCLEVAELVIGAPVECCSP